MCTKMFTKALSTIVKMKTYKLYNNRHEVFTTTWTTMKPLK